MKSLVEFPLESGGSILVEVDEPSKVDDRVALPGQRQINKAQQSLECALEKIKPVANAIATQVRDIDVSPHEVEVKFGIKMTAGLGVIIASGNGEVNYEVTLKWKSENKDVHPS